MRRDYEEIRGIGEPFASYELPSESAPPQAAPRRVGTTDVFACGVCDDDYHAHWFCPVCDHGNLCAYLDPDTKIGKDTCEGCGTPVEVVGRCSWEDD